MKHLSASQILAMDKDHIWHPYSSVVDPAPVYPVASADGVRLYLADGRALIDGMSSWWCTIHGYNHPALNAAITAQMSKMSHVMFGGITHEPAAKLAQTLAEITPAGLDKVFLSDSGSVSIEVAMKMALQYWQSQGEKGKSRFLSLKRGYHGDTFGAMSVCDPVTGMHHLFRDVLVPQFFAESPQCGFDDAWSEDFIIDFKQTITANADEIAAVVLEPVVQGAGGMRFYSPVFLKRVRELCDQHDVLLIIDEIATGFGRTGKLFATEWAGISPDIMCLGKALTGGYMTLAATLCTEKVSNGICLGEAGVFMHGPTFMGNPLACAVANASIELLLTSDWSTRVKDIEQQLAAELAPAKDYNHVEDVRVLGAIGVIEMKNPVNLPIIQKQFVNQGVWVRPFGKLVYVMPPYIISKTDLSVLTSVLVDVVKDAAQ
ncbi:adenosylmethionine--8-amino-7-oxononanoate transaminase [uncultured Porticoccus sp.]|uniref:adenosylmethionine--8-amino-7-oxononanoate transaminase n=1 Tax=uncultured Porticoccus sp. TaxID=1256050 RepID=UPI002611EDFB|nr:adenosylmethionine--8-amino-7-oxononanoate transaminase [uncultured Porticoccus sp.]